MDAPSGVHLPRFCALALIISGHCFSGVVNEASYFYDPSWPEARDVFVKVRCLCVPQGHSALARKMFSQLYRSMN
jgi:hypothetical protein